MKPKSNKLRIAVFLGVMFFCFSTTLEALEFTYKFKSGDKYRIVSTVNEDVFIDRRLTYYAEIINRIAIEVIDVNGDTAKLAAVFQSAENTVAVGNTRNYSEAYPFRWARDYHSEFTQNGLGYMNVPEQYYMPMVRDVPVFPNRNLEIGDSWTADGLEVHDFRDSFGIVKPYEIPFSASYTYLGERSWKDKQYPAFAVSYRIFLEPERVTGRVYPLRIHSASDQIVFWDTEYGQAVAYEEEFRTILDLSDGQTYEYRGRAEAEVIEAPPMNKEEMILAIAEDVNDIQGASVRISDEGIVISLENIQFAADSALLLSSEYQKLDIIAEILLRYPERDILVNGHTALAGTAEGRLLLSQERAAAVADYLIKKNVRTHDRVLVRGHGGEQPIADNRTPEGMAKNRRVEIVILEN